MNKIRVLVVDDHPLMREALCVAIGDEPDMEVVGEAGDGLEAVEQARLLQPDVILMDLLMPGRGGLEATSEIMADNPEARILVLTSATDETKMLAAAQVGVLGYLLKDTPRAGLLHAIREVSRGNAFLPPNLTRKLLESVRQPHPRAAASPEAAPTEPLTGREREVLKLIGEGYSNRDIAEKLYLSEGTVRTHVHHILNKLRLKNRNQAILYVLKAAIQGG